MSDRPRVYSEQEASEIVKRAAELAETKATNSYKSGITRAELERIASEMGVPIDALNEAIRESEAPAKDSKHRFNLNPKLETVVDFEANEDDFATVLDMVNPMRRQAVVLTQKRLEVVTMTGLMQTRITAQSRNGRTRIGLEGKGWVAFMATAYPFFIFALTTSPHLMRVNMFAGIALAVTLMTVGLLAFWLAAQWSQRKFTQFAADVKARLEQSHGETSENLRTNLSNSSDRIEDASTQSHQA